LPTIGTHGLAWRALRSRRQRDQPSTFLEPTLVELINNSGWYDGVDEAVIDTIPAAAEIGRQMGTARPALTISE
jgi:hypothetical protein